MRSSSIDSNGNDLGSSPQAGAVPISSNGLRRRARSFSITIKSRFKRAFWGQNSEGTALPTQQLAATKAHFRDYLDKLDRESQSDRPILSFDEDALLRSEPCENTAEAELSSLDRDTSTASIRSVKVEGSLDDTQSRVTSWANSTNADSILPYQSLEKNRLSVIQEHGGPHQPSSSVLRHGVLGPAYSAFSKPPPGQTRLDDPTGFADSQLIRAVLKQRLEDKHQAEVADHHDDDQRSQTDWSMPALPAPPFRTSSKTGHKNLLNSWAEEEEARRSPSSQEDSQGSMSVIRVAHPHMSEDDIFKPREVSIKEGTSAASSQTVSFSESSYSGHDEATSRHQTKRPLRDVRSTFFPPSTHVERNSTSPYRRAMQSSSADQSFTSVETDRGNSIRLLNVPDSIRHMRTSSATDSGSVYSQSADGNTPRPGQSPTSVEQAAHETVTGTATIIRHDSSPRIFESSYHVRGKSNSSAKSSGDWKTWMATEVATLDRYPPKAEKTRRRRFGHTREDAEIHSDGESGVGNLEKGDPVHKHRAPKIAAEAVKHRSSLPHLRRSPLSDLGIASRTNDTTPVRRENDGRRGHDSSQGQDENVRPDRGSQSAVALRPKLSNYSLTPTDTSPVPKSRFSMQGQSAPSRDAGTMFGASLDNEQVDSERTRRLKRIQSSLSSTSQGTPEAKKPPDAGRDGAMPGGQSMINFVMGRVRRNISMAGKDNGDAAFL